MAVRRFIGMQSNKRMNESKDSGGYIILRGSFRIIWVVPSQTTPNVDEETCLVKLAVFFHGRVNT
jgi:hypothetical protein